MFVGLLLLVAVGVVVAQSIAHHRAATPAGPSARAPRPLAPAADRRRQEPVAPVAPSLSDELDEWSTAGLISPEQARAIADHERSKLAELGSAATAEPARRTPAVAEALGYLGGVLALVGLVLLVGTRWDDLAVGMRLAMSGGAAVALVLGGRAVDETRDPALARLRWSLWLAGTAAAVLFAAVMAVDVVGWHGSAVVAACAAAATAVSGSLWAGRDRPVQELVALVAAVVLAGTTAGTVAGDGSAGAAVWLTGAFVLVVGLARLTSLPGIPVAVGAVALPVGAVVSTNEWQAFGLLTMVLTGVGLLALVAVEGPVAARGDRIVLSVVGAVTLAQSLPPSLVHFAGQAGVVTGLLVWLAGVALVVAAGSAAVRVPTIVRAAGGVAMLGGAALTAAQVPALAMLFGLATAIALVAVGTRPGFVVLSLAGALGLLVFVPWSIGWFFPGEGRAPLLILVTGALILGVAVLLARSGRRLRDELGPR